MSVLIVLSLPWTLAGIASGYSLGAPNDACDSMVPGHIPHKPSNDTLAPYFISVDKHEVRIGDRVTVTLQALETGKTNFFKGFLLMARNASNPQEVSESTGTFLGNAQEFRFPACTADSTASTHRRPTRKMSVTLQWVPSDGYLGNVVFLASFVQSYDTFWVGVQSQTIHVLPRQSLAESLTEEETLPDPPPPSTEVPKDFTKTSKKSESSWPVRLLETLNFS